MIVRCIVIGGVRSVWKVRRRGEKNSRKFAMTSRSISFAFSNHNVSFERSLIESLLQK